MIQINIKTPYSKIHQRKKKDGYSKGRNGISVTIFFIKKPLVPPYPPPGRSRCALGALLNARPRCFRWFNDQFSDEFPLITAWLWSLPPVNRHGTTEGRCVFGFLHMLQFLVFFLSIRSTFFQVLEDGSFRPFAPIRHRRQHLPVRVEWFPNNRNGSTKSPYLGNYLKRNIHSTSIYLFYRVFVDA